MVYLGRGKLAPVQPPQQVAMLNVQNAGEELGVSRPRNRVGKHILLQRECHLDETTLQGGLSLELIASCHGSKRGDMRMGFFFSSSSFFRYCTLGAHRRSLRPIVRQRRL
jgi:hypothetical protein